MCAPVTINRALDRTRVCQLVSLQRIIKFPILLSIYLRLGRLTCGIFGIALTVSIHNLFHIILLVL